MQKYIKIKGARQHNLKNIDVTIPRDKFVVITGMSGSGKSSLAIDTIYAEGQRRYLESLNSYARQFLGSMEKPDVDYIEGLSPSIAIEQKTVSKNPRSTVGTITEIYDYLRLLYANIGIPHCPICNDEIKPLTTQEMTEEIIKKITLKEKFRVLSPIVQRKKGEYSAVFNKLKRDGFTRVIVDEIEYELDEKITLDKNVFHDIDVVIDRLVMKDDSEFKRRLADSIEQASTLSEGLVKIWVVDKPPKIYSENYYCPRDEFSFPAIRPQLFSFNTPVGFCQACNGLGNRSEFTERMMFPDKSKSIYESNLMEMGGFKSAGSYSWQIIEAVADHYDVDLNVPIEDIPEGKWIKIVFGSGDEKISFDFSSDNGNPMGGNGKEFSYSYKRPFEGILNTLQRRYFETSSSSAREHYETWMEILTCNVCKGQKLRPEALAVTINDTNIHEFSTYTVDHALHFMEILEKDLSKNQKKVVKDVNKEINSRYTFLKNVGLDYLSMNRLARTLSGGESERVRLATQIGSNLVGVLYVLDEPSIGLHSRDKFKLINMLHALRDKGNSIIVVEHDDDIINHSDFVIDIGPAAGIHGGEIIVADDLEKMKKHPTSITAQYLRGEKFIPIPKYRRQNYNHYIEIKNAKENNLKDIDVKIPLGVFNVCTGVSGAGKSSLIMECVYKGLYTNLNPRSKIRPGIYSEISGLDHIDKIIHIDQQPIGRTPRSIPATYVDIFTNIREIFTATKEAKLQGYDKGRFSFNTKKGRCEKCRGVGYLNIEMQFLPDVEVKCDVCHGRRYNAETLMVDFKGKNISQVLELSFENALDFFKAFPKILKKVQTMVDVGLGYIELGQSSTTLSGGEAQRVKLSRELSKRSTGKTLYILDEPTTGLHFQDVKQLLKVLQRLVDGGNTIIVIEHNMDVIKTADYLIDLGPEGGDEGGYVVAIGTPEEIAQNKKSYTGKYLKPILDYHTSNNHFEIVKKRQEMPINK